MKMMTRLSIYLTGVLISFIFPLQEGTSSDNQSLSARVFSKLPEIESIRISPDGKQLIFLQNIRNYTVLASRHLETGKVTGIVKTDNKEFKFRLIRWANNDTILFSAAFPYRRYGIPTIESRLLVTKSDGSEKYKVLVKPKTTFSGFRDHFSQFQDNIISLLPDDPQHILVGIDLNRPTLPTVYEIDVDTGSRKRIQRCKDRVRDWIADQQGRIRVANTFDENTTQTSTLIYNLANKEWMEVWRSKVFSGPPITPLGFGKDPNILYIRADHNGRNAIFTVDVTKNDLPLQLIAKDDKYDINGSLIYSPKKRDVVGVYHSEAAGERIYWDKGFQRFQAAVDKALLDTSNYLIDFSRNERHYIVYATSDTKPGIYYLGDRDRGTLNLIAHTYPQLEGKLQGSKKVKYTARDGKTIEAYLTLPANHTPGKPCPALIFPHGGPMVRDYGGFDEWAEFLANKGIVVLQPNFRGSSGYGWEFEQEAIQNYGLTMQDDLTDAANWLIEQKLADPKRLSIIGASYGGYAALMGAVKTPDLFKCAISFAGVSDLKALRDSRQHYLSYRVAREQLGTDTTQLKATSPCRHVDKIKIPILLAHGENDRVVSVEQSRKMAKELEGRNKVYTYIELKDGDHSLSIQENRHKFFSSMDEFLDKYLLDK
jgi:dipeptidyl aminopeptidase/acylaminoacyl peptidase